MKPGTFIRVAVTIGSLLIAGADVSAASSLQFASFTKSSPTSVGNASALNTPFVREQLKYERVRNARRAVEARVEAMFAERGIDFPSAEMFLRVFKHEKKLELWVRAPEDQKFQLLKTYEICALAGIVGPKAKQGDQQVPEGFYFIDLFNPVSNYHLSMRIDYPNKRDRLNNVRNWKLGGNIFIHGGCKSEGCVAITDEGIEELYWMAVNVRAYGQRRIPVHIFPTRLNNEGVMKQLRKAYRPPPDILAFWDELRPGFEYFEKHKTLPQVVVTAEGRYELAPTHLASRSD